MKFGTIVPHSSSKCVSTDESIFVMLSHVQDSSYILCYSFLLFITVEQDKSLTPARLVSMFAIGWYVGESSECGITYPRWELPTTPGML